MLRSSHASGAVRVQPLCEERVEWPMRHQTNAVRDGGAERKDRVAAFCLNVSVPGAVNAAPLAAVRA